MPDTDVIVRVVEEVARVVVASPAAVSVVETAEDAHTVRLEGGPVRVVSAVGGDKFYTHDQPTPAAVWDVTHNLGKYPSVSAVDSAGRWWVGAVEYVDENRLRVYFSAGFSGKAYLN